MPLVTLRNYASDLKKIGCVMVFRGTIGDISKLKPTIEFMRSIMVTDLDCMKRGCDVLNLNVAIDPKRFAYYGIDKVPATLLETNVSFEPNCRETSYNKQSEIVFGDASLTSILRQMDKKDKNETIKQYIDKLEGRA